MGPGDRPRKGYIEMTNKEIYIEVFKAFSMMSDAQELMSMGLIKEANDTLNGAKRDHLHKIAEADPEGYRDAMFEATA